jgi:glutamate/tyrosine decarboxylase-like PLP-dependent enzyme
MKKYHNEKEEENSKNPLTAWFLGPKAENSQIWKEMINYIFDDYIHWRRNYFPTDPVVVNRIKRRSHESWFDQLSTELEMVLNQLKADYPFYSPRYIAHMLSEQSLPSVLGYFAGMLYNPNNVTDQAAPVTVPLEIEVGKIIAEMLGYDPVTSWTHITSGGTIANLEALWVARTTQFAPLITQEYCKENQLDFEINIPGTIEQARIKDLSPVELLSMRPEETIFIYRKLAIYLITILGRTQEEVLSSINKHIRNSTFNIAQNGFLGALKEFDLVPKIFISQAAHYSIKKVANILGYGEQHIKTIPVESNFRLDIDALQNEIFNMPDNAYIASVVGILGTTEEGAIDPIHRIQQIKEDLEQKANKSFWLHVDAAWGGYMKSLFLLNDHIDPEISEDLDRAYSFYEQKLDIKEVFDIRHKEKLLVKDAKIEWDDPEVFKALLSLQVADSTTVDPHKLGYVPYPAGVISFKNGIVTEHIVQEAQYISEEKGGIKNINELLEIKAVGPYILEGSKPGAAAAATWMAHKIIKLDTHGHGKIIRTTILNTRKLVRYIDAHESMFSDIDELLFGVDNKPANPFLFRYLYMPDSNVVCFIAFPMEYLKDGVTPKTIDLPDLNDINFQLYKLLSIHDASTPYSQEFFVSKTEFRDSQYSFESIKTLLKRLKIEESDYKAHGLFALRCTLMNPWHWEAQKSGMDYLMEFIINLHKLTREILNN